MPAWAEMQELKLSFGWKDSKYWENKYPQTQDDRMGVL